MNLRQFLLPSAIVITGTALSIFIFAAAKSEAEIVARAQFVSQAQERSRAVERRVNSELNAVRALVALFNSSSFVSREEFRRFVETMGISRASQALEWIPRVEGGKRAAYERSAIEEGVDDFRFTELTVDERLAPASQRETHYPIYYSEPYQRNTKALGFDLASVSIHLRAIEQARDSGEFVASEHIQLDTLGQGDNDVLIFAPVYRNGQPHDTLEQRREHFEGVVLGVFSTPLLISGTLESKTNKRTFATPAGIDLYLFDESLSLPQQLLYIHHSRARELQGLPSAPRLSLNQALATTHLSHPFLVAGREWNIVARPISPTLGIAISINQMGILIAGILITLLLAAFTVASSRRSETIKRLVVERTRELDRASHRAQDEQARVSAILETAIDAIITIDSRGTIESFNPAATRIFGYAADEVIGNNVNCLMPSPYREEHDGYLQRYQQSGEAHIIGIGREVTGQRKDGTTFPMELAVSAMQVADRQMYTGLVRDITERKEAEQRLLDEKSRVSAILETAIDAIITIDSRGTIESFNPAATRIFGYPADEVIGNNVNCLMPSPYREEHDGYLQRYQQSGEARVIGSGREVIGRRKDGSTFPMELAVSAMQVAEREMYTGIVRDITERKEAEDQMRKAKEVAEQSNRTKSEFLNMMSHELRTPLTVIIGYMPLLTNEETLPDAATIAAIARDMESSGNHLLHLINDLLDISKIEAGKMALKPETFAIHEMVQLVLEQLSIKADEKQTRLLNRVEETSLTADLIRLKQILINLIGNAIKFTEGGVITVASRRLEDGVEFSVSDTGCGIPAADLPHIFDKFQQVDSSSTRAAGGTGLGLAITQKLIELHHGTISVTSEEGRGTTFTFTIMNMKEHEHG